MSYFGLLFEALFLVLGIYLYLFARGLIKAKDEATQARFDEFRAQNGGWMRIAAIALVAIMSVNLVIHILQLIR